MREDRSLSELADLLVWYRAMGVDEAIGDAPTHWLAANAAVPGATERAAIRQLVQSQQAGAKQVTAGSAPMTTPRSRANAVSAAPRQTPADDPMALQPHINQTAPVARSATPDRRFPTTAPSEAASEARRAAQAATSLDQLRAALGSFNGCGLKATAKHLCFYRGAAAARVMVIGEAPGREEDHLGLPFVGPAGQLLDKMLTAIELRADHSGSPDRDENLARSDGAKHEQSSKQAGRKSRLKADSKSERNNVHITNIVYWRPPGNRPATPLEAQICRPFLTRQIELVGPDYVLLLGGLAAKTVLETSQGIMRLRGKWRDITVKDRQIKVLATLHPTHLLRTPEAKRLAWQDLLALKKELKSA